MRKTDPFRFIDLLEWEFYLPLNKNLLSALCLFFVHLYYLADFVLFINFSVYFYLNVEF